MGKKKQLYNLRGNISDNALKIKYLLENVLYKSDNEQESFVMNSMALDFVKEIKTSAEKIGKILKH